MSLLISIIIIITIKPMKIDVEVPTFTEKVQIKSKDR